VIGQAAELFEPSVAFSVKVWLRKHPFTCTIPALQLGVSEPAQLSLAVTSASASTQVGGVGLQPKSMAAAGQPVNVGGIVSLTVMICVQVATRPQASVAVQVRVIVPPQGPPTREPSLEVTGPQLSETVPPVKSGAGAGRHWMEKPAGQVMLGMVFGQKV
jgi:hypothetical protein